MGRLREAYRVLQGQKLTPQQVEAQWIEYQILFDGVLDKLNMALARMAKREQRQVQRLADALAAPEPNGNHPASGGTPQDRKAELRRRFWANRGVALPSQDAREAPPPPEPVEVS